MRNFARVIIFTTTVILFGAACRQPSASLPPSPNDQKNMEYYLDHAIFTVPSSLRDITLYTFGKTDKSEFLEVHNSEREATLDELSAEITDQAVDGVGLTLSAERDTKVADLPARILEFSGEDRGKSFRQFFVLVIVPSSAQTNIRHLEIKYLTTSDAETANANLERMLKSARRERGAAESPSSEHYRRQTAGIISLEIPLDWRGGGFQFTMREDAPAITDESVTFEISEIQQIKDPSLNQNQPAASPAAGEAEMEEDINTDLNAGGQILERQTTNVSVAGSNGTILSYAVNNAPPWEKEPKNKLVRRAYLPISGAVEVRVVGRADSRKRSILEENFNQIVNSLRKR